MEPPCCVVRLRDGLWPCEHGKEDDDEFEEFESSISSTSSSC